MAKKTTTYQWQKTEKQAADFVCTKRSPFSGSNSGVTSGDSLHSRLFLEVKTKQKHSIKTLYDSTKKLAEEESKIPVLALRETDDKDILWVMAQKDLIELLKEVNLHYLDKSIPSGTYVGQLLEERKGDNLDLYKAEQKLKSKLQSIFTNKTLSETQTKKILTRDVLEEIKAVGYLLECVAMIKKFIEEEM